MIKHDLDARLGAVEERCCTRQRALSRLLPRTSGGGREAIHAGIEFERWLAECARLARRRPDCRGPSPGLL